MTGSNDTEGTLSTGKGQRRTGRINEKVKNKRLQRLKHLGDIRWPPGCDNSHSVFWLFLTFCPENLSRFSLWPCFGFVLLVAASFLDQKFRQFTTIFMNLNTETEHRWDQSCWQRSRPPTQTVDRLMSSSPSQPYRGGRGTNICNLTDLTG